MQGFGQKQQQNDGCDLIYWIWLSKIPGIGVKTRRALLEWFGGSPKQVYEADEAEYRKIRDVGEKKAKNIVQSKSLEVTEVILDNCLKSHISIMTMRDAIYPDYAKFLFDMPTHLYYKSTVGVNQDGIAIVGARRCTHEGKTRAVELANQAVDSGRMVISGMAKGIDSYAHTACLKANGYTVAVLGNGLDVCYPSEHSLLKQRIEERGLLLSEYEPGVLPRREYFPRRNRIIAAWSKEIYIVEAGLKSGALITADYGRRYGRRVTVYPALR